MEEQFQLSNTQKRQMKVKYKKIQLKDLEFDLGDSFFERGQFGDVKRAKWNSIEVAIKCFTSPDRKGGFAEELVNLSLLQSHDHIVRMFGACVSDHPFIVLEFAPLSLEKVIHECKKDYRYTSDHVMSWSHQAAVGLLYVHDQNILHRDIKPSNMLLFDKGKVLKLCDFGTAKKLEHTLTNAVGTIRYMAPEVIRGRYYTDRCDVFSFGMMMWEMLARKKPILLGTSKGNNMAILYAMANGARPPKLSNLPRAVAEMIDNCWNEEPQKRPTMSEIKHKLDYLCQFIETGKPLITRRKPHPPRAQTTESLAPPKHIVLVSEELSEGQPSLREESISESNPTTSVDIPTSVNQPSVGSHSVSGESPSVTSQPSLPRSQILSDSKPSVEPSLPDITSLQIENHPLKPDVSEVPPPVPLHRNRTATAPHTQQFQHKAPEGLTKQLSTPNHHTSFYSDTHTSTYPRSNMKSSNYPNSNQIQPASQHDQVMKKKYSSRLPSRFPCAVEGSQYYITGLDTDLQPIIPNETVQSMDLYRQFKQCADQIVKGVEEQNKLREEISNLEKEIEEDHQRLEGKEGVQREYKQRCNEKEKLMNQLKTMQETYNNLRRGSVN